MYIHRKAHFTNKAFNVFISEKELIDNIYYSWEKNKAQKSINRQRTEEKEKT